MKLSNRIFNNPNAGLYNHRPKVVVLDSSSTTLPTSLLIDGVLLQDDDRVLFTNLLNPAENNRIYKVNKTSFKIETDGSGNNGEAKPGDVVYVLQGTHAGELWGFGGVWEVLDVDIFAGGDVNNASNIGGGIGIFKQKVEDTLEIKTLVAGANQTITPVGDTLVFASTTDTSGHEAALDPHTQYQKESEKDLPNGYAGLDSGGKVLVNTLPNSVMTFHDFWNATTNSPSLSDGTGNAGQVYEVSVAGSQDLGSGVQSFDIGDWVVYTGTGIWKKSINSAAAIPDASDVVAGKVNITAQTFGGHKTFKDGLTSQEEIIISSTLNPYASIRTANTNGDSQKIVIASGDSVIGDSGEVLIASGAATKTAPSTLLIQGVTFGVKVAVGKSTHFMSVQIIVDDTNITNPAAPAYNTRGSAGQRLEIRVNSATTVDQLIAAFPVSGAVFNNFTATGSALTTFTNDVQYFSGAKDAGQTVVASDYQVRIESGQLMLGESDNPYGQLGIIGADVSGSQSSDTLFILSGRVKGTGNSGGISMRTNDMEGSGGSGGMFIRTGSVNGTLASGSTNIATGATTQFSTANTGGVNINSGNIGGISGNSGNVFVSSGAFASTTLSGTTGQVQIFTGNYAGSGSVSGGLLFVGGAGFTGAGSGTTSALSMRSGDKTNAAATGNTGTLTVRSGNHSGTGSSGTAFFASGNVVHGTSGNVTLTSGSHTGTSGSGTATVFIRTGSISGALVGGTTGNFQWSTGSVTNAGSTANVGFVSISSGSNAGSNASGSVAIFSGETSGTGNSGDMNISTGATSSSGSSGQIVVASGNANGSGNTNQVLFRSGNTFGGGNTGNAVINSGDVTTGSGSSGVAQLYSGNTNSGNSGNIEIYTGTSVSGNRGTVNITGKYVQLTSQTGGNIHLLTETNGAVAFFANGVLKSAINTGNQNQYGVDIHSALQASSQNDRTNIGLMAGSDSGGATVGGTVLIAGGFGGVASQNGGDVQINSGGSAAGVGGNVKLRVNGLGTTVGKIQLDGVMKAYVRTGHTNFEDGDIWFDGTNLNMRIGGVTKTFVMV